MSGRNYCSLQSIQSFPLKTPPLLVTLENPLRQAVSSQRVDGGPRPTGRAFAQRLRAVGADDLGEQ